MNRLGSTFVVAVDGSEYAQEALRQAIRWAKALGAELVLVNVQPDYDTPNIRRFVSEKLISDYQQEMADSVLKPAVQLVQAEDPSVPCTAVMRVGSPGVEICNEARERGAMGIIMGSRGMGPIRGAFLGSVSYSVLHNAPCPVTIVS
jgi:nucleotide-binding universal stress UspA family protein